MKRGTIITLHKGGRKTKKDPQNYRVISLTSAVLKLFERLILDKLYDCLEKPFNYMQGGFRPCGCDNVYNEHLLYGTNKLFAELVVLFSDMYNYCYIPKSMKRGTIITLHKGGRKTKKESNISYVGCSKII